MGERRGVLEMRKNYGGYFKGMPNGAVVRGRLMETTEFPAVLEILCSVEVSPEADEALPASVPG
jgi:tRNA-dihydrouridine synthase